MKRTKEELTNIILNDDADDECLSTSERVDHVEPLLNFVAEEEMIDECHGSVTEEETDDDDNSDEWERYSDFANTDSSNSDNDSDWSS